MNQKLDAVLPELSAVPKSKSSAEFSLRTHDKLIISANAIFEGIGIAGLIAAAFWYTTAPMAPDGFKGPISTFTITVTTIISLFLAIPIGRYAYNKLILDAHRLCADLNLKAQEYLYSCTELTYDLLKLRSLCTSDIELLNHLRLLNENQTLVLDEATLQRVCYEYQRLEKNSIPIKWENQADHSYALSLSDILKNRDLSNHKLIKQNIVPLMQNDSLNNESKLDQMINDAWVQVPKQSRLKNTIFGIASGVACAEVLLSIGWTVISILIGIKAIVPISNFCWAFFAILCIIAGTLFGLGMGLSRHKQKKLQALYSHINEKNNKLIESCDHLNQMISEHSFHLSRTYELPKDSNHTCKEAVPVK